MQDEIPAPPQPPGPPGTGHDDPGPPPPPRRNSGRLLLGIGVFGFLAFVGLTAGAVLMARQEWSPSVEENSFLEVRLQGDMTDAPAEGGLFMDPAQFPPLITEVSAAIREAAGDARIKGLYLEPSGGFGWAASQELRDAVAAFSASGKPCYAYGDEFDNKSYYIASACKEIYIAPAGVMLVNGLAVTNEYYAGIFDKIGVKADFEHVGDYKSAVEPFQRSGPTDAASEAMDMLIGGLYDQMVDGIAAGRGVPREQVLGWIEQTPITPQAALDAGMVTALKYRDEVREGLAGEDRTGISDYISAGRSVLPDDKVIAVIHAEGAIVDGESSTSMFGGRSVGDRTLEELFEEVRDDEAVAAVVLRVNSPGGSGMASDMIWRSIRRTQEKQKPVVVSMGDYAASGGYYISAPADRIVAEPGTITGSIGVFGGKMNIAGVYEKLGITTHTWKRGGMAELFTGIGGFSDPERAKFREFLAGFYDVFLTRVSDGRKLTKEQVHAVAQGRVWTGQQALERGLVDELGGLDVAIQRARELAKIGAEEEVGLRRLPRQKTLVEQLMEDLEAQSAQPTIRLSPELALPRATAALDDLLLLDQVLAGGGVAAILPGRLSVE